MYVCMYIHIYIYLSIDRSLSKSLSLSLSLYIHIYVCISLSTYIYIYSYMYILYIYIYEYIDRSIYLDTTGRCYRCLRKQLPVTGASNIRSCNNLLIAHAILITAETPLQSLIWCSESLYYSQCCFFLQSSIIFTYTGTSRGLILCRLALRRRVADDIRRSLNDYNSNNDTTTNNNNNNNNNDNNNNNNDNSNNNDSYNDNNNQY